MSRASGDAIPRSRPSAVKSPSSMATSRSRLLNADTGSIVIVIVVIAAPLHSWLEPDIDGRQAELGTTGHGSDLFRIVGHERPPGVHVTPRPPYPGIEEDP